MVYLIVSILIENSNEVGNWYWFENWRRLEWRFFYLEGIREVNLYKLICNMIIIFIYY